MPPPPSPIDRVLGAVVPMAVDAIDPDDLLDRIDLDALLQRIDVDALVARIDLDTLVGRIDLDTLVGQIDLDTLVGRIDLDALLQRIDVDSLVGRIDVDAIVRRVDVDGLVGDLDVDGLVGRLDLDVLLARVDLDALMAGVDVRALVAQAGIDQIVADATTGLAARTLEVARRQVEALDRVVRRAIDRILRRDAPPVDDGAPRTAGPVGRLLGFMVDSVVVSTTFSLGVALVTFLIQLFTARQVDSTTGGEPLWAAAFGLWWLVYLWIGIAVAGRTVGKGLVGLRVLAEDGSAAGAGRAARRAVAFPFSFILGLGFLPVVFGRRGRTFHDHVAGTIEVVEWGKAPVTTLRTVGDGTGSGSAATAIAAPAA